MKLNLAYYGNPILRKKARPVEKFDKELEALIEDMFETMFACKGIGLAAPQVGISLRIFVTCVPVPSLDDPDQWDEGEKLVFINPEISEPSKESWHYDEGCLSIPALNGDVVRPYSIFCKAYDAKGNEHSRLYEGLEARCIMHENDHINGVLFIDRVKGPERQELEPALERIKKELGKKQSERVNPLVHLFD